MDTVRIESLPPAAPAPNEPAPETGWAVVAHLLPFVCSPLAPVFIILAVGKVNRFARQHARQSVNFSLNLAVGLFFAIVLTALAPLFALLWLPVGIAAVALPIVAAVRANRGQWVPYPPMIPFLANLPEHG